MASIHVSEIQRILVERGEREASAATASGEGFFLEIHFNDPTGLRGVVDEEYKNKVLTVHCYLGLATIVFDASGILRSIDIS